MLDFANEKYFAAPKAEQAAHSSIPEVTPEVSSAPDATRSLRMEDFGFSRRSSEASLEDEKKSVLPSTPGDAPRMLPPAPKTIGQVDADQRILELCWKNSTPPLVSTKELETALQTAKEKALKRKRVPSRPRVHDIVLPQPSADVSRVTNPRSRVSQTRKMSGADHQAGKQVKKKGSASPKERRFWCRKYRKWRKGRKFEYKPLPFAAKDVTKIRNTEHWLGGIAFELNNDTRRWYVRPQHTTNAEDFESKLNWYVNPHPSKSGTDTAAKIETQTFQEDIEDFLKGAPERAGEFRAAMYKFRKEENAESFLRRLLSAKSRPPCPNGCAPRQTCPQCHP